MPGAERHYPPDLELEPIHLEIDLTIDLDGQSIEGSVTHTVRARHGGPRTLELNAVDVGVESVEDAGGAALSWRYDGEALTITWADGFAANEQRRAVVMYRVERPSAGLYFSKPTDAYPDDPWFAATDHETERARHWLPCVDLPSVRPRLDLRLRADARLTILANGSLVAETDHGDGTKTAHWRLEQPCPSYLTCFLVGELIRYDDGEHDGRPVAYFTTTNYGPEELERTFGRTPRMLAWLTEKVGSPLPYPKYFQFAVRGIGGAMENISLVSWDDRFVLDETLAAEWTWLVDQINIHEMAHSFFGDWIVCRDFAHAWLKESWAVYIEQCWLEDQRGADEAQYDFYANAQAYFTEADERYQRPIVTRTFNHSWDLYDRHLYPGGACRLHTLRNEVGDEVFWAAVRDYVATFGGQVVETDDFRRMVERHSGRSLGRFFDQWFHSKGYPSLEVTYEHDDEKGEATFEVVQKQVDAKKGVPAFHLSLDLAWEVAGTWITRSVELTEATHSFAFKVDSEPTQVRVDPQAKVLHRLSFNPGDSLLRRQLTEAPDVIGRIRAARELTKTGRLRNVAAVGKAYEGEPFWGVRVRMAQALAEAGTQSASDVLAGVLASENDPMVLEHAIRASGDLRSTEVAEVLRRRLSDGLPYRAAGAAWEVLGKLRQAAPLEELSTAAQTSDFHGFVQSGALAGLAETRQDAALDLLIDRTALGATGHNARPAAVRALGTLGAGLDKRPRERVCDHLIGLLRDPVDTIREAAVTALKSMGASEATEALESVRHRVSAQERVTVERALQAIRKSATPRAATLEKQVEELTGRLRKMEHALRKLEARLEEATE